MSRLETKEIEENICKAFEIQKNKLLWKFVEAFLIKYFKYH